MDRVKIPSGSVQKLETVFDDLQTLVHGNLNNRCHYRNIWNSECIEKRCSGCYINWLKSYCI